MRILVIAPRFHNNLYYRVRGLQKDGHEVRILSLYEGVSESHKKVDIKILGYSRFFSLISRTIKWRKKNYLKSSFELKFGFPCLRKLRSEIEQFNPDLVLLKAYQDLLSFWSLVFAKMKKVKVVILTQTRKNHIKGSRFLLKSYLWFFGKMGVIAYISPTKKTKNIFNQIGAINTFCVPFVFPVKDFKKQYFRDDKINIIAVYKFIPTANFESLLSAVSLVGNNKKIKLTLVGERVDRGYIKKLEKIIKEKSLKNVIFKFNLDHDEMKDVYFGADVFVLPGKSVAAYSIVEAMSMKLPVVCGDNCGTYEYVKDGSSGYVFEGGNNNSLIKGIGEITKDRNKIIDMGEKSFQIAMKSHSLVTFAKNISVILDKYNAKKK